MAPSLQNAIGAGWDPPWASHTTCSLVSSFPNQKGTGCSPGAKSILLPMDASVFVFLLLFCSFLNKIRVLHAQPAATTRSQVFSGTLGGFFHLPSTVPCSYPRERWNRLCDRSWSLKLLSFCSKSVVSFNLTEIRCSPCEHLAVMISVNFRLPNPRTAPRAVSHCFHVPCLQKYARGFSFVSFLF